MKVYGLYRGGPLNAVTVEDRGSIYRWGDGSTCPSGQGDAMIRGRQSRTHCGVYARDGKDYVWHSTCGPHLP